jgi:hypothetical protein
MFAFGEASSLRHENSPGSGGRIEAVKLGQDAMNTVETLGLLFSSMQD